MLWFERNGVWFLEHFLPHCVGTHQRTAETDDLAIEINNALLQRVNRFKYRGVLLDNILSWKDHIGISAIISRLD